MNAAVSEIHVIKAGLVAVLTDGVAAPRILVVQPYGKQDDMGPPPLVLPRGTRRYRDPKTGQLKDARRQEDAQAFAAQLEPLRETVMAEAEEEAGIPRRFFVDGHKLVSLGVQPYATPKGEPYPIYWEAMLLSPADIPLLGSTQDSQQRQFMTIADYAQAAYEGRAREGYVAVMKEALASLGI